VKAILQNLTTDRVVWTYENDRGTTGATTPIPRTPHLNLFLLECSVEHSCRTALANDFLRRQSPALLTEELLVPVGITEINVYRNEVH
jgi:hypothetical protein